MHKTSAPIWNTIKIQFKKEPEYRINLGYWLNLDRTQLMNIYWNTNINILQVCFIGSRSRFQQTLQSFTSNRYKYVPGMIFLCQFTRPQLPSNVWFDLNDDDGYLPCQQNINWNIYFSFINDSEGRTLSIELSYKIWFFLF